jgi:hypothetical protein
MSDFAELCQINIEGLRIRFPQFSIWLTGEFASSAFRGKSGSFQERQQSVRGHEDIECCRCHTIGRCDIAAQFIGRRGVICQ